MSDYLISRDDYFPNPPEKKDYGIGLIGCGGIVQYAHLPAYEKCGYRVVACADINEDNARAAAAKVNTESYSTDVSDVLNHPEVEIIDLAVHATQRLSVIEQICTHDCKPRGILSQKPFAMNLQEAERMVHLCEDAGIVLMINQQARWAPGHRALKHIIDSGHLGHVYSVLHLSRSWQDNPASWYVKLENFNIVDHGIHFIDLSRFFTDLTPQRVKATTTMVPDQAAVTPMIYSILLEYEKSANVMSTLHFNNIVQVHETMGRGEWFVDGTDGSAIVGSDFVYCFKSDRKHKHTVSLEGSWFPDAFGGSMGELMQSLTEGREPITSGRDNLNSIKIAYAAVESSNSGETVTLQ
jgi:predicted dehydrogenase